jgi:hypothetical protein
LGYRIHKPKENTKRRGWGGAKGRDIKIAWKVDVKEGISKVVSKKKSYDLSLAKE